jgi:phospholipid transport system substrate-binding protein
MRVPSSVLAFGLTALLLLGGPAQPALAAGGAADFIAQAGNSVLSLARDRNLSEAQLKQRLSKIAEQDFDAPRIAKFVLGRYWRTASEQERQQFVQAFEAYMVQVYASRFRQYGGAQFKVTGERQEGQTTMVTTDIDRPNGQPAHVVWQVAKTPDGYKITDVSIEGISQAVTYRQEFSSVIEQNGGRIAALTQQLREKASS